MRRHLRNDSEQVLDSEIRDDNLILLDGGYIACRLSPHGGCRCRLRASCPLPTMKARKEKESKALHF